MNKVIFVIFLKKVIIIIIIIIIINHYLAVWDAYFFGFVTYFL